jgi:hypothetical integral membrane protein (TIGR02206 family)
MWEYFFTPPTVSVPDSVSFGIFSPVHLLTLVVLAGGITAVVIAYRRSGQSTRHRLRLVIGWATIMLELIKQVVLLVTDQYSVSYLPLQLCSVSLFCVFIDALKPNRWCREIFYALTIWSAAAALIFPDWATQPWSNIFSWQSFVIHALLITYALMLLASGEVRPNWRNLWRVIVVIAVVVPVAMLVNHIYDTNFWFLNQGSPGSPLAPIQALTGAFYIPTLIVLLGILWTVMYLPWVLADRKRALQSTLVEKSASFDG